MQKQSIVSLIGLPGAGKTTLAARLANFGLKHLVAGDVARDLAAVDHEVAEALANGQMAPKEKMNRAMLEVTMNTLQDGKSVLFDGYPRYIQQYDQLMALPFEHSNFYFIYVGCNDSTAIDRLAQPREGRIDDTPKAIAQRVANFWIETWPVVQKLAEDHPHRTLHTPIGTQADVVNVSVDFLIRNGVI